MKPEHAATIASLFAVAACSTVIDGTSQTIRINTSPMGARCVLTRDAKILAEVTAPGRIEVEKSKQDIQAVCMADGYDDKMVTLRSGMAAATFANFVVTAGIGWTVDSLTGADNKYPETVSVILRKPAPRPAQPQPASATQPPIASQAEGQ